MEGRCPQRPKINRSPGNQHSPVTRRPSRHNKLDGRCPQRPKLIGRRGRRPSKEKLNLKK